MMDAQARPRSDLRRLILVGLIGIVSALVTFAFMALVIQVTNLIWKQAALPMLAAFITSPFLL